MVPCSNVVDFRGHFLYFTTGYRHGFLVKYGYHVQNTYITGWRGAGENAKRSPFTSSGCSRWRGPPCLIIAC